MHYKEEEDGSHVVTLLDTHFIWYFFLSFSHSYIDEAVVVKFSDYIDEGEGKSKFSQDGVQYFMLNQIKSFHKIYE